MKTVETHRAGLSLQRLSRVDRLLESYVDGGLLAGTMGLIYRRGETVYYNAFGLREIESGQPMTEDTVFRIYSMTKPITSVAALMLFEAGHFLLDDPVANYLPEFEGAQVCTGDLDNLAAPDRPPTVKDLFLHTAGLSYGWDQDSPVEELYRQTFANREQLPLDKFTQELAALPLLYHPGTRWRYSYATDVLGRLVEVLSGKSLDEFFQQEIFKPLDMRETAFQVDARSLDRFSACYCPPGGFSFSSDPEPDTETASGGPDEGDHAEEPTIELLESSRDSRFTKTPVFLSGGGGLVSTNGDYLRFSQMLLNGGVLDGQRLLGPRTVEMMRANHLPANLVPIAIGADAHAGYGFGLCGSVLVDLPATSTPGNVGIYGWGGAASTQFWIDPEEEMLGIFMTQYMPAGYYPVAREFRVAAYQAIVD
ncbi:MAG: beta-lactamase family protein [Caldilineaceae bacterium SB0664_bin_27]|uniref:Beta-lactamase family protein n=1 Tax=Caldilineaceae bacterium SB0664_bin_27 TaxID=2605260 RepID=A0A6B0YNY3_9CHLR|nr:beta-lactamase family protein [Caldilineaceae bacterium SB0664_bin_27]